MRVHIDEVPSSVELSLGMTATVSAGRAVSPTSYHGLISRMFTHVSE